MSISIRFLILLAALVLPLAARAQLTVPSFFSTHAVLQKTAKVPVWGKASPGDNVTVSIAGASAQATADANGAWRAVLDLSAQGPGPFDLTIADGANKIVANDVLIGEVWLASGQSNMGFSLKNAIGGPEEIAASANPLLRVFTVADKASATPLDDVKGSWSVAGPTTSTYFTAVGYYFAKKVQNELGVPVGLIHSSWGGTFAEAWTSLDALHSNPELKEGADKALQAYQDFPTTSQTYVKALQDWETQYNRDLTPPADVSTFAGPAVSTTDWKPVTLPGKLSAAGLPDAGAIWVRRTVTLPQGNITANLPIELGPVNGFDTVYWNGELFGQTKPENGGITASRRYYKPGTMTLQAGDGVLAIRIAQPAGGAAFAPSLKWGSVVLDGPWVAKAEKELPPMDDIAKAAYPAPLPAAPRLQDNPSWLYNGMIAPLIPYAIRGTVWYQGENNVGRAFQYRTVFPLMITDWRTRWGEGDFPFYWCQLANFTARKTVPGEDAWAELREAQAKTLSLPNTGMAVLIDVGDETNVHPRDKKTTGNRLAAIALANAYGKQIPFSGPTYDTMTVEGGSIRIHFTHTDGGLVAKDLPADYAPTSIEPDQKKPLVRNSPNSQVEGFAICGADHVWKWADAKIDKDSVVVSAAGVDQPVAVRYAWAGDPICNLYNGAGFPTVPFRTDDFPMTTANKKL